MTMRKALRAKLAKAPTLEATFSRKIRDALRTFGIASIKTNDRVNRGIPDIYFPHGNWIESKVAVGQIGIVANHPIRGFTAIQRSTLDALVAGGDHCFAAIMWYPREDDRHFLFMPWWNFRRIIFWEDADLMHFGVKWPKGTNWLQMERFFVNGRYDPEWFDSKWKLWNQESNPNRFNANFHEPTLDELVEESDGTADDD